MIRLFLYCAALVVVGDMARRAVIVRADSFVLPLVLLCLWLLVLIVRACRREHRRLTDFVRPRGFP